MEKSYEDIWYAARATQIVYMPPKLLETFGETNVKYTLLSEDMDNPTRIHLREGLVQAARPRIITPQFFRAQAIENFGAEARRYFDEVLSKDMNARFLQYGLCFRKEELTKQTVSGDIREIAEQAAKDAQDEWRELRGVIIGCDDSWEISLLHFITKLVHRSLPRNAKELSQHGMFELKQGIPVGIRQDLEEEFGQCASLDAARNLGAKLRDYGLFEEYEDRFFELYRSLK